MRQRVLHTVGSIAALVTAPALLAPPASAQGWVCDAWQAFGSLNERIYDVLGASGNLVVCGAFTVVDGQPMNRVAIHDGTGWAPMGAGFPLTMFALCEHNGEIIAAGVAGGSPHRWDGTAWQSVRTIYGGPSGNVYALLSHQGSLYAGGRFTTAGVLTVNRVARYDGERWWPLAAGLDGEVWALGTYQGRVVAGGDFVTGSGQSLDHVALWDGAQWLPLGAGLNGRVHALLEYQGDLVAAGAFTTAGGQPASGVARWDGAQWHSLGSGVGGQARSLLIVNDDLIVGGAFLVAGGQPAFNVARWTGAAWSPVGIGPNGAVHDLALWYGILFAGGEYTMAQGLPAERIARWTDCEGACCVNDGCLVLTSAHCAAIGGTFQGQGWTCATSPCPPACPSDLNGDGVVNVFDLLLVLDGWGGCP